jgi:hypothetical protein
MRRTAAWVLAFAAALVVPCSVSGCGDGGGGGNAGAHAQNVRATLTTILVAAAKGDAASATPHLAVAEFRGMFTESKPKPWGELTEQERTQATSECFNQTLQVAKQTTLRDQASIAAALAAGSTTVHERISKGEVAFSGPAADGSANPANFVANLTLGHDGRWRLVTLEMKFR